MDKKAQASINIGIIITSFVAIIVGVVLFQAVAQEAGTSTTLGSVTDLSIGTVTNGTVVYLDYRAISDVVLMNTTGLVELDAGNYTVTNNVIDPSDGTLSTSITPIADSQYSGLDWSMNATVQPQTYVADSAARSVIALIAIFFALAIAIVAIEPTLRSGVIGAFK